MTFSTSSSTNALIMNGKAAHVVNPWHITIDLENETITIRKRNKILIGVDEKVIAFKYVRNIIVDEHLFGADMHIKVLGGTASVYCLSKSDAQHIKEMLLEHNRTKGGKSIVVI